MSRWAPSNNFDLVVHAQTAKVIVADSVRRLGRSGRRTASGSRRCWGAILHVGLSIGAGILSCAGASTGNAARGCFAPASWRRRDSAEGGGGWGVGVAVGVARCHLGVLGLGKVVGLVVGVDYRVTYEDT